MGYRVSTATFALLFAAMVVKDLTRPEPETAPQPPAATEAERSEAAPGGPAAEGASVEGPLEEPGVGGAIPDPVPAADLALRLVSPHMYADDWERLLPLLRERREEMIPIFEDWLRRRAELAKERISLDFVPRAYAELAGLDALARLWGPPWPERYRELVTVGLDDADPWVRSYAADRIIRDREHVTADLLARAERVLEQDLARGKPEGDAPEPKYLKASLERLRQWRAEEEAERRKRELLTPR